MSYVHRLTLALKHCWASLRRRGTARSGAFASPSSTSGNAGSRSSIWSRLRAAWLNVRAQAQSKMAQIRPKMAQARAQTQAQAQTRFRQARGYAQAAQARARHFTGQKFQGVPSGSKLKRFGVWLGKSIAYSVALSLALSALIFGIGAAVAGHSWHDRPQGFAKLSTVAEIQTSSFDEQEVQVQGRLTNYLYKDFYEFTDELGNSIEVELDDDIDWSPVHKDQLIAIYGEVERNLFKLIIDVKDYRILEEMPPVQAAATEAAPSELESAQTAPAPEATATLESDEVEVEPDPVHLSIDDGASGIKLEHINYEMP